MSDSLTDDNGHVPVVGRQQAGEGVAQRGGVLQVVQHHDGRQRRLLAGRRGAALLRDVGEVRAQLVARLAVHTKTNVQS